MKPLQNLKVVDLTTNIAGPYCTMLLADMGAEVWKIERPGVGDPARAAGKPSEGAPGAPMFLAVNRNKRSVTLELEKPQDRDALLRMVETADILVESMAPGAIAKFDIGYDVMRAVKPSLIYCSVSGFGRSGPLANERAYDQIVQAASGIMSLTITSDGPPQRIPVSAIDIFTGGLAYGAIVTALLKRAADGSGEYIDMTMYHAGTNLLSYWVPEYALGGKAVDPGAGFAPLSPIGRFRASDQYFCLAAGTEPSWRKLCDAIGASRLAADPRFRTNADRVAHRSELTEALNAVFAGGTAAEWEAKLRGARIAASRVRDVSEILLDPFTLDSGAVVPFADRHSDVFVPGNPLRLASVDVEARFPPDLGGNNHEL